LTSRPVRPNIAIDGPAASGKTTVARLLARRLGLTFFDTGAMYRALAWEALRRRLDPDDEAAMTELAREMDLQVRRCGQDLRILAGGSDVTGELNSPEVSRAVARVARIPGVRREMVRRQRELASAGGYILAGRDIGTVVLPDAPLKIYLTAGPAVRAWRRYQELGGSLTLDEVESEMAERDRIDASRADSPMRPAPDARLIDSDNLTPEQVVEQIARLYEAL
jgi:cytidylate kinase